MELSNSYGNGFIRSALAGRGEKHARTSLTLDIKGFSWRNMNSISCDACKLLTGGAVFKKPFYIFLVFGLLCFICSSRVFSGNSPFGGKPAPG